MDLDPWPCPIDHDLPVFLTTVPGTDQKTAELLLQRLVAGEPSGDQGGMDLPATLWLFNIAMENHHFW